MDRFLLRMLTSNHRYGRFDESSFGSMNADRRLLWHGSRATNFGGILSQGLRIAPPEAPVSGYMFGKGVYLADMSSKSANYCYHQTSGNMGLLLLCEAELGKPLLELTDADYDAGERAKEQGSYSTWGKGRTAPKKWKDARVVHDALEGVAMPDIATKPGASNVEGAYLEYVLVLCSVSSALTQTGTTSTSRTTSPRFACAISSVSGWPDMVTKRPREASHPAITLSRVRSTKG